MNPDPVTPVAVHYVDSNGTWLVALGGEHDLSTAPRLEALTTGVWPVASLAVVDLSGATFVDATTIRWLMKAGDTIAAAGNGALRVVLGPADGPASRLLDLLSLTAQLRCYATRDEAFAGTGPSADPLREQMASLT